MQCFLLFWFKSIIERLHNPNQIKVKKETGKLNRSQYTVYDDVCTSV